MPQFSPLEQCLQAAASASAGALGRCLDQVAGQLQAAQQHAVKQTERTELADAWRDLLAHKADWCSRYPHDLRASFSAAMQAKPITVKSTGRGASGRNEFTLVDDADIVDAIESSRLLQHVLPLVERPVSELDALVSSALGLDTVRPELNPLRPEVFAQTLRATVAQGGGHAGASSLWMKYLAEPLGSELLIIYGQLVDQLKQAHVQAVGYRVMPAAPGSGAPTAKAGSSEETAPAMATPPASVRGAAPMTAPPDAYASLSSRQISHALLRDFLIHGAGPQSLQALPQSYYAEVQQELAALQEPGDSERAPLHPQSAPQSYRDLPAVDRPARQVGVRSTLDPQVWGTYARSRERSLVRSQLRQDATRVAQVLGLELVRKVVDQVAQDPRLLAPVREAIVALEPSLLRLAMVDPRFFSEEHHPGRHLMERVAQRSFKYNDEFSPEFGAFFSQLSESFNNLNRSAVESTQPFEEGLAQLEGRWQERDREDQEQRREAVDAVQFAERRQAEADQIAWVLSSRADLENVPSVVQDFLFGPWALVMAHARLTDGQNQIDPHGYGGVITDLLWSVKREVTLKQPAQLFERLPRLLGTLRAGLASIGQDPTESEPFFQELMKLHHPVLKLRRAKSRRDARESGIAPLTAVHAPAEPGPAQAKAPTGHPWMSARELDAAGFEETLPTDMADLAEASPSRPSPLAPEASGGTESAGSSQEQQDAPDPANVLAQLHERDWVDLYSKGRWLRAQLIWASSKGTLFMFVSHGGQPHSMTKRICERLIRERFLRPVRTHNVVAKALQVLEHDDAGDAHVEATQAQYRRAPARRDAAVPTT